MIADALKNYKGGLTGIFGLIMIQGILYVLAFFVAIISQTPTAQMILHSIGLVTQIVLAPHMIPISYVVGCFTFNKKRKPHVF